MKLIVLLGSSRTKRRGEKVANWVKAIAAQDNRFEIDYVDIRELNLPFYDEPLSPFAFEGAQYDYANPSGKAWAERVKAADGFIVVTPEYNHGYPPVLKNALDWVGPEWGHKPIGFISYSTNRTGGARSVEQLRQVIVELDMHSVSQAVHIADVDKVFLDDSGNTPAGQQQLEGALRSVIDAVVRYCQNQKATSASVAY